MGKKRHFWTCHRRVNLDLDDLIGATVIGGHVDRKIAEIKWLQLKTKHGKSLIVYPISLIRDKLDETFEPKSWMEAREG